MQLPGLSTTLVATISVVCMATGVSADCWDGKCTIYGAVALANCGRACRNEGYVYSDLETYIRLWPPFAGTYCTCGSYHSEDCRHCARRGTPCKSREDETREFLSGRIPRC